MILDINQLQDRLYASKKCLFTFPDAASDSDKNSVEPSDSIKGGNVRGKSMKVNELIGGAV